MYHNRVRPPKANQPGKSTRLKMLERWMGLVIELPQLPIYVAWVLPARGPFSGLQ
jgi:hypothetical protein